MSFEQDAQVLADKQHDEDLVVVARRQLEPTRAAALAALQEFKDLSATLRPTFAAALERFELAAKLGVTHREVWNCVQAAYRIMQGGEAGLASIVQEIDNLTYYEVVQRHPRSIPGRLDAYKSNFGALRDLAAKLPFHLSELEARVAHEAKSATPYTPPTAVPGGVTVPPAPPAGDPFPHPPAV